MNKGAIWLIIGLMSIALIGSILLQAYWINWSISLEEKRFDKDIFDALNTVAEKMQRFEELNENLKALSYLPGFEEQLFSKSAQKVNQKGGVLSVEYFLDQDINLDSLISGQSLLNYYQEEDLCQAIDCLHCQQKRLERSQFLLDYWGKRKVYQIVSPPPLEERMDLHALDTFIMQELRSRGIRTVYNYGVFSNKKNSFVIRNGHYVIPEDDSPQSTVSVDNYLADSKYKVRLFPSDLEIQSPGMLMIHFPSKASVVWRSGWKTLLASIVFTSIILFCFTYTIQVIFKQKKLSEMKTDFINNMTHEFKTPIATISLAADSISSPMIKGDPTKVSRFADIIRQENRRMNKQVEKVLQMARIDRRDFNLKLIQLNLHDIIQQAVSNTSLQVERRNGKITTQLDAEMPVIHGDQTHITNIIHNLLENANKYSPNNPEITVFTKNHARGVVVTVQDKGIGMSKEAKKHIFDKFYRVHTGNRHDVKGFGLGLSYVKALMDAHKGDISVKTEPGKGSSFSLFFPFKVD